MALPDRLRLPEDADRLALLFLASYANENTRLSYTRDLGRYWEWCRRLGLDPLLAERPHLEAYISWLTQHAARSTAARGTSVVASFYRYATDLGVLARSPMAGVRRPKAPTTSPVVGLDLEEAADLLDAARSAGPRDHLLICLLLLNGLRVAEICRAKVEDLAVTRGHHVLRVRRKGGDEAWHALAPRTAGAVATHLAERGHPAQGPLVAAHTHRGHISRGLFIWRLSELGKLAGIGKHLHPHALRHTAVTMAYDAGVPERDVQFFAGHSDPRTTMRYDRARGQLDRHATYRLAEYLESAIVRRAAGVGSEDGHKEKEAGP